MTAQYTPPDIQIFNLQAAADFTGIIHWLYHKMQVMKISQGTCLGNLLNRDKHYAYQCRAFGLLHKYFSCQHVILLVSDSKIIIRERYCLVTMINHIMI